jgi:hypothetical protein
MFVNDKKADFLQCRPFLMEKFPRHKGGWLQEMLSDGGKHGGASFCAFTEKFLGLWLLLGVTLRNDVVATQK